LEKQKKALILDDEAYIRRLFEVKLENRGFTVFSADNGERGLELFRSHQPDIVITDIKMPHMDGKVFCERTHDLKKERPFLTVVVSCSVPMSTWNWVDSMQDTVFFEKPFSPTKILECIDQYFQSRDDREEVKGT
jgi:DNA-binding NtrC family response regulator